MNSKYSFELKGKKALITGSTEGIGLAIAKCLATQGCEIIIHDKADTARCEEACSIIRQINKKETPYLIANFEDLAAIEVLLSQLNAIDILILNASMQSKQGVLTIDRLTFEQHVNTNFWATLRLIQHTAGHMLQQGWGRIINIGSIQETKPHPEMAIYAALKAATSNLMVNLAIQFGSGGITVNTVAPGVIQTRRNEDALANTAYADQLKKKIPLGTFGQADDCSGIALLLCSEAGQYITGQTIYCDGGMSIQ